MKKILAVDMDGTFYKDDKTLSNELINSVKEMLEEDNYFVIDSGRPYYRCDEILDILKEYPKNVYCVCFNGGVVFDYDGNIIHDEYLDHELVVKFLDYFKTLNNLALMVFPVDCIYNYCSDELYPLLLSIDPINQIRSNYENLYNIDNVIKFVVVGNSSDIKIARNNLPQEFIDNFFIGTNGNETFELMPKHVNKGYGLKVLMNYLGISKENVIACGDQENDLAMLKVAGTSTCVGNAVKELKDYCDYIAPTNNEDGVKEVIKKFIL